MSGIATALLLTHPNNPEAGRYDVTVYQLGWRLGGKCASGRNLDSEKGGRIEEHGLHLMLGFYENTFRLIRDTMAEWNLPDGHPWSAPQNTDRWSRAFTPAWFAPLVEPRKDGSWDVWSLGFPRLPGTPGDGSPPRDDLVDFLSSLDAWRKRLMGMMAHGGPPKKQLRDWLANAAQDADARKRYAKRRRHRRPRPISMLSIACGVTRLAALGLKRRGLLGWRRKFRKLEQQSGDAQILYTFLDLGAALFCGLLWNAFAIYWKTLDVLDKYELRDFLRRYGAQDSSLESPLIDALYDAAFASRGGTGKRADENLAAGVAIRSFIGITLAYKGAPWWKMNAGMGDTLFVPAYEVLKQRGVKFRFFHRVRDLELDGGAVRSVRMGLQTYTRDPRSGSRLPPGEYDPLVPFKVTGNDGKELPVPLMTWPSAPKSDWLDAATQLSGIDPAELENPDSSMADVEQVVLSKGTDFDRIVLAVPIAVIPSICKQLLQVNPKVKRMVEKVETVRTACYQVWLTKDLLEMGWDKGSAVLGNFVDPMNTWSDMTHLLPVEGTQKGVQPRNISYFCGAMPEDIPAIRAKAYVAAEAAGLMNAMAKNFLPGALDHATSGFDARLRISDYVRANISTTDRYTLSLAGTTQYRLRVDETGLSNMYFAGDWTRNNFNIGAAEPTVMSAMQASNAISGYPPMESIVRNAGP